MSKSNATTRQIQWTTDGAFPGCIGLIVCGGESLPITQSAESPGVAATFGRPLTMTQRDGQGYCPHRGTDGSIDCPDCGVTATQFIAEATDWLENNDGMTADDPGYFN